MKRLKGARRMKNVWISGIMSDPRYGTKKQGIREKFYGHDWEKPTHITPVQPPEVNDAMHRHARGELLRREEFPEAAYIFSESHFRNVGDFFYVCGFMAAKGKLAEVLKHAELGKGGLVQFPIYQNDKKTPAEGEFFFLNFGGPKDTFLPEESNQKVLEIKATVAKHGFELWSAKAGYEDEDIAVSPTALEGDDIWFERKLWRKLFMSQSLVENLSTTGVKTDFSLKKCRIVGEMENDAVCR